MREFKGFTSIIVSTYTFLVMLYHVVFASGILYWFNIDLGGFHAAISVGLVLSILYLYYPLSKTAPKHILPWYDLSLAILCLIPTFYYAITFERTLYSSLTPNTLEILLGLVMFLLAMEGVRRAIGWPLVIFGLLFLIYPRIAYYLPGILFASPVSWSRLIGDIYLGTQGIFSTAAHVFATVISIFVIFGQLINVSGGGQFFLDLSFSLLGKQRGGPAKAAVVGSGLFGMISGIAVANVMTTGSITIPMMKRLGYSPEFAGAVETVASVGGAIMPPVMGILAFVMADYLGIPYWNIVIAGIIPALLYYLALYLQVTFHCEKLAIGGIAEENLPSFSRTLKAGWIFLIPLIEMIYMFAELGWSPLRVGFYVTLTVFVLYAVKYGVTHKRLSWEVPQRTFQAFVDSGTSLAAIMPAACLAGIIMASVNLTAIGLRLSAGLLQLAGDNLFILLVLAALACLIMGTAVDLIVIYIIMAVLIAPAMIQMGILPLAAHLFILYYTVVGLITPPVCVATYAAAAIAKSKPFLTAFYAMKLGFVAIIMPFIFVVRPALLMIGPWHHILGTTLIALCAVIALAIAIEGFFFVMQIPMYLRILFGIAGFSLFYPHVIFDLIGLGLLAVAVGIALPSAIRHETKPDRF